ncbi:MAG: hypothetical protein GX846_04140 [Deltaproteobacteria bacterium]|nr:hypothetical protein [Deltaproteobacteria bacterium]
MNLMSLQKTFMKIAMALVVLSIVAIVTLLFFRHHIMKKKSAPAVTVESAFDKETKFNYSGMTLTIDTSKPVKIPKDMKKKPAAQEKDILELDPYPPVSESN